MPTIQQAYHGLLSQLYELYDAREAATIADWVIENITGQKKIDRLLHKTLPLIPSQTEQLENYTQLLLQHKPVQYVLNEAWFYGVNFQVNESVLIPRPETEELVAWAIDIIKSTDHKVYSLLDIGTGSGCIPITIKKQLPKTQVAAVDISPEALQIAKQNAAIHHTDIAWYLGNILKPNEYQAVGVYDMIISNPPYVLDEEKPTLLPQVLLYEPSTALFVPNENPLVFYEAIAVFAKAHLHKEGVLLVEINEAFGEATMQLFQQYQFKNIELRKDLQGKDRMIKAESPEL